MVKDSKVKRATKTAAKKAKKLSDSQIFVLAGKYEEAHRTEASAKKTKTDSAKQIISELMGRKTRSLETKENGFTRVTVVQKETLQYDRDGLWRVLTPAQRRAAFDADLNLNQLSAAARKRVIASLTKEERNAVTTHSLNLDRLAQAVIEGTIEAQVVSEHSEIVKAAPYISISHGSGE